MTEVSFFKPETNNEAEIKRMRKYAELMQQQAVQPLNTEMVSGIAVKRSPVEGLAKMLTGVLANNAQGKADELEKQDQLKQARRYAEAMKLYGTDPQAAAQVLMQDPASAQVGLTLGTSFADQQRKNDFEMQKAQAESASKNAQWEKDAALKRELANMRLNGGAGGGTIDPETGVFVPQYSNKPLPAPALKMQNEALDSLANSSDISNKAKAIIDNIDAGKLDLGPVDNLISRARNWAGMSNDKSLAFGDMTSTLQKIRNDSLRLNKGVQTEGDAQRAYQEVIDSVNDPALLKQAMEKLNAINERGAELQRQMVGSVRQNYNVAPYDFSKVEALPAGVAPKAAPAQSKYKDGQTATMPDGSKIVFKNGAWGKM